MAFSIPAECSPISSLDLEPSLGLALHGYQKSKMRAEGMEGAVILGLTPLELLGALTVVIARA
jgi:hypothetical protein